MLTIQEIHQAIQRAVGKEFLLTIVHASQIPAPPAMIQAMAFLEERGKEAAPFTQDVGNLIGKDKWTSVEQYFKERRDQFQ